MPTRWNALVAASLLLVGCGESGDTPPERASPDENVALANAAEILDTSPDSLTVSEDALPAGESEANFVE
jgi:hypothetical protein